MKAVAARFTVIALLSMFIAGAAVYGETPTVPAAVMDAFKKAYPNAKLKSVSSEKEDGRLEYELEIVDGAAIRNVIYAGNGKLIAVEDGIAAAELPRVVADAVARKYPMGTLSTVERVRSAAGKISYEMVVTTGGKKVSVEIDDAGKIH